MNIYSFEVNTLKKIKIWVASLSCLLVMTYIGIVIMDKLAPKMVVSHILDEILTLNYEQFDPEGFSKMPTYKKNLIDEFLKTDSYEVKEVSVKKDTALVTVSLTHIDVKTLMENHQDLVLENVFKNLSSSFVDLISGGEEKFAINAVLKLLQDESLVKPTEDTVVNINLTKENGRWIPKFDEELIMTLFENKDWAMPLN